MISASQRELWKEVCLDIQQGFSKQEIIQRVLEEMTENPYANDMVSDYALMLSDIYEMLGSNTTLLSREKIGRLVDSQLSLQEMSVI